MNAPEKIPRIQLAPGIYVIRPAKARVSRQRAALSLLAAMRRGRHTQRGKTGQKYLKDIRAARYDR